MAQCHRRVEDVECDVHSSHIIPTRFWRWLSERHPGVDYPGVVEVDSTVKTSGSKSFFDGCGEWLTDPLQRKYQCQSSKPIRDKLYTKFIEGPVWSYALLDLILDELGVLSTRRQDEYLVWLRVEQRSEEGNRTIEASKLLDTTFTQQLELFRQV